MDLDPRFLVRDAAALQARYGEPGEASLVKEQDRLTAEYRALIEASPFVALATSGPGGLDVSPRGEWPRIVTIEDDRTLLLPDRRGNNRIDSLRNVVADPRVALLFLIPGSGQTLRVNGQAAISVDPALLARFAVEGKEPRSVLVVRIETVFFQCARAVLRAGLWDASRHVSPRDLPSAGDILAACTAGRFDGKGYDKEWPARAKATMW
ncbi:pyridoxamine 5'-phosphate oxidase family protein [Alsobacter sp. SYSU M60028]|uniref:Pyridoxamine 5'-phosphate oxidase family protein n=1 Tax=Alsobacter ponti TaxID=2962936 RepID=A0ABT1L8F9_9HYPH|nr:pyridoxamine 5'-phosphate oxidase family protein [Alsobacter ponti]MCP8937208.1 pyridoxamine 5'-phosphate oxidase family protein [Alsobacter ponti]